MLERLKCKKFVYFHHLPVSLVYTGTHICLAVGACFSLVMILFLSLSLSLSLPLCLTLSVSLPVPLSHNPRGVKVKTFLFLPRKKLLTFQNKERFSLSLSHSLPLFLEGRIGNLI